MAESKSKPIGLGRAVGEGVRRLRTLDDLRQEDVARDMRHYGLAGWTSRTVANVENGRRDLGLEELLLLCAVLKCRPADLFDADVRVRLSDAATADATSLRNLLGGIPLLASPTTANDWVQLKRFRHSHAALTTALYAQLGERHPELDEAARRRIALSGPDDAEKNAANRLGLPYLDVVVAAYNLWRRSLSEERDRRVAERAAVGASPRSIQALRGHVTQDMTKELRAALPTGAAPDETASTPKKGRQR